MYPKPRFPWDKIRRPPWNGKRMTLIAAFFCKDGLLIAADREESTATSKRAVSKIRAVLGGERANWATVIATAGNGATADLALERLMKRLDPMSTEGLRKKHQEIIRDTVASVYRDCIWKNPDRDRQELDFSLLVGISIMDSKEQFLYRTMGIVPQPIHSHICAGIGEDLANYFADRLYSQRMTRRELMLLAAFIFREAQQAVPTVGQGTDNVFMFKGAGFFGGSLDSIGKDLPNFADVVQKFWTDTKLMPKWLKDKRLDLGAMSRAQQRYYEKHQDSKRRKQKAER
jgi:20S proteasome alpha/beta subunit